jgi:hypothetical protein
LERLREVEAIAPAVVHAQFWPEATCAAALVRAPAVVLLMAMYPAFSAVRVVARDVADTAAAATQRFGVPPFDPARYGRELLRLARQRDWPVTGAS